MPVCRLVIAIKMGMKYSPFEHRSFHGVRAMARASLLRSVEYMTEETNKQLPQLVGEVADVLSAPADASGSIWKLEPHTRGLDCNIISIAPGEEIARHEGPDLDVVIVVLDGSGVLETEGEAISLNDGSLVWLPKLSVRRFVAGENGLRYFSVHTRKRGLQIGRPPARD